MDLNLPALNKRASVFVITSCVVGSMLLHQVQACGDFRLPSNHFEGVSEKGEVSRWEQLGTLDLGDTTLPLIIGFQTYRKYASPELGAGWILPLLDANIIQRDENTFDMVQPDGLIGGSARDSFNPNILHGPGSWVGEINGDAITMTASCGSGWKLVFTRGKLTSLIKENHTLTIVRDDQGRAMEVKDGANPVMTLDKDEKTGLAKSITMGDAKYQLAYDDKPRIETIKGQNLVAGVDKTLHQIIYPKEQGGSSESFDFAVTDKLLPNLKITDTEGKEKMIVWDTTGHIIQDGEWNYTVTPPQSGNKYAAIERKNQSNQSEFWYNDDVKGEEVIKNLDGTKTVSNWFVSGMVAGKLRKQIEIYPNGKKLIKFQSSYDEKGQPLRIKRGDIVETFIDGKLNNITKNNTMLWNIIRKNSANEKITYNPIK